MEFQLTVSTDVLKSVAEEISGSIECIKQEWSEIRNIVENSEYYWEGDSSTEHRKRLSEINDDVETTIKRLAEHPGDLLQMAGIYDTTEKSISGMNSNLPADVIV